MPREVDVVLNSHRSDDFVKRMAMATTSTSRSLRTRAMSAPHNRRLWEEEEEEGTCRQKTASWK